MSLSWSGVMFNTLALICPLSMAILSQQLGTRSWRVGIYPLGVISAVLAILCLADQARRTRAPGDTPNSFIALYANAILVYNLSLIGLYAFSDDVYRPHPIPPSVQWRSLRSSRIFKIIDIFISSDRKLNYSPNPVPPWKPKTGLGNTIKWAIIHNLLTDFFTLPTLLRSHGLYHPDGTRDFQKWCSTLGETYGLPVLVVRIGLMGCYAGTVFSGIQGGWEITKTIEVWSGIWAEEEWVEIMDRPYLSTSMLELWGKRYHQLMRSEFHTILSPFNLPKPLYLFGSFLISGFHHLLIMSPLTGTFPVHYLRFFLGCGSICLVEYWTYMMTGRKVEGLAGWIWTFSWIYLLGIGSLEREVESGGFEGFRMPVEVHGWSAYPLDHVVSVIGWCTGSSA